MAEHQRRGALAELTVALSLAIDFCTGQPMKHGVLVVAAIGTLVAPGPATSANVPAPPVLSERPLVWFAPLPPLPMDAGRPFVGSDDFAELFRPGADWSRAAGRIDVFKLYGEWVDVTDLASLQAAVAGIEARGMVLAVEAGPLNPTAECGHGIEGFAGRESGLRLAKKIEQAGGTLQVIALDEPWYFANVYDGPNACRWTVDHVAAETAAFVEGVHDVFPWVVVGDIEPTPAPVSPAMLTEWLDAYAAAAGQPFAFVHLDVDWSRGDWPALALELEGRARERGVPFGLIYNGGSAATDATWLHQAGSRIVAYEVDAGGRPDHIVFQSWMDKPDHALPESDPLSFTALVNSYFDDRAALDDPPAGTAFNLALGRPASASSELPEAPASSAVDGDTETLWNAGAGPPASIDIDLGRPETIREVRLLAAQDPRGPTQHRITGRVSEEGPAVELGVLVGTTADNDVLEITIDPATPAIRYVTVETIASPSWVAWREIEVIAAPP